MSVVSRLTIHALARTIAAATPLVDHARRAEQARWNLTLPNCGG